ncbi:DUF1801 domain-containing protein [Flavobacterium psychrotrophum]|uniref:DUF1801 domain-containing protein n=1 Tax=Flavobacterium psychrotrophum TaxID=2294119 RepID=UPI000E318452|nr:DUF1801 domain-containing protein [Flavobacterium psychrotrophum]
MKYTPEIQTYNDALTAEDTAIANFLAQTITENLPGAENKIWHAHPVWFLDGNPVVGYSKLKNNMRLMFWSGQSFDEELLNLNGKKFKDAAIAYTHVSQINIKDLNRWLRKATEIQWDYKNIVKRKGVLIRIK